MEQQSVDCLFPLTTNAYSSDVPTPLPPSQPPPSFFEHFSQPRQEEQRNPLKVVKRTLWGRGAGGLKRVRNVRPFADVSDHLRWVPFLSLSPSGGTWEREEKKRRNEANLRLEKDFFI
ncbi:hypothetical protein CEXT_56841 [Caerostris extrusa]|uniref:Uncharacterized protein n=1 Tax=Caerostris extrusa TaxID=172846 RepID=A0AAV4TX34_CAEEX|nr:hypothetical protein CEXT_56841 [Caerostris extrusa]